MIESLAKRQRSTGELQRYFQNNERQKVLLILLFKKIESLAKRQTYLI